MNDRLVVFARYPKAGESKTRLIPALGSQGAADLYCQMVQHTLANVRSFLVHSLPGQTTEVAVYVAVEDQAAQTQLQKMKAWLGDEFNYHPQTQGDLGQRMAQAFQQSFDLGVQRVIIIGTDCPGLNGEILAVAFKQLHQHELVMGPAIDGGYYLIGLQRAIPELFVDVSWGSSQVLQQTLTIAAHLRLSTALLPTLADVDRPGDLSIWEDHLGR